MGWLVLGLAVYALVQRHRKRQWEKAAKECLQKYEFAVALTEAMGEELNEMPNVVVLPNHMSMN